MRQQKIVAVNDILESGVGPGGNPGIGVDEVLAHVHETLMKERLAATTRREQIAEAALAIVVEQGIGALTVRNVARLLGLSATALYRHYKNKADILSSVLDVVCRFGAETERKAREESKSPLAMLHNLFKRHVIFLQRYPALPILFQSDLLWRDEPMLAARLRDDIRRERAVIVDLIRQGQQEGQILADIDPVLLCNNFIGLYVVPALMLSRPIEAFHVLKQADVNWRLFEKAVKP